MPLNFNQSPYYDDFSETKKFHRVLYKPKVAVQTRELNQTQSIFQKQIERFADHVFNHGSMVIPGQITYDREYQFVKIEDTQPNLSAVVLSNFQPDSDGNNKIIQGVTSGITAEVLNAVEASGADPITLFVKYIDSGADNETIEFTDGENLQAIVDGAPGNEIGQVITGNAVNPATGSGSAASIQEGVYYVFGTFVSVSDQTIVLEKYSDTPTLKVGLEIQETIISSEDDTSLNDNASGTSNFAAPGADRYKVDLILTSKAVDAIDDERFVELMRLKAGVREKHVQTTDYSIIEETLARRTYDESGNYTVRPFGIDIREHNDNGVNRGVYLPAGTPAGDNTKLAIGLEPGKAFVKGFEIDTISTTFVDVDKARDFTSGNNGSSRAQIGNYILVNGLYNVPDVDDFVEVELHDVIVSTPGSDPGSQIGTARVRGIEYHSGVIGSGNEVYRVYLFKIELNSGETLTNVRSLYDAGSPGVTADVLSELIISQVEGTFTVGQSYGDGTNSELVISWNANTGRLITQSPDANGIIPLGSAFVASGTLTTARLLQRLKIQETNKNTLVYRLPQNTIKTLKPDSISDTTYSTRRIFTGTASSNEVSFSAQANEIFTSFSTSDYILAYTSGVNIGDIVALTSSQVTFGGSPTGSSITISGLDNESVKLMATVTKGVSGSGKVEKTKTLVESASITVATPTSSVLLNKADCFRIVAVYDGTDTTGTEISEQYEFDNGQRDSYYDIGRINLKPGNPGATSGNVHIIFDYFTHGSGDYFSVDSYLNQVEYANIPSFVSKLDGQFYDLKDCVDFRPRIDDNGSTFTTTGEAPKINSDIRFDFEYYLARIDKIFLNENGEFKVAKGTSAISPLPPDDPVDGMVLYILSLGAFTFSTDDVFVTQIDNRRYTMRDIGKLERRIENLEYYASLNLLEKDTASQTIKDAATGLDRFKSGFVVDNMTGHDVGDVFNPDYRCSIDAARGKMRPQYVSNNAGLGLQEDRSFGYELNSLKAEGELITLPYTEDPFLIQPFASEFLNVNPYSIFSWVGSLTLDPPMDEWKDTARRPDVLITDNTAFESLVFMDEASGLLGTVWDEWRTEWSGVSESRDRLDSSSSEVVIGSGGRTVRVDSRTGNEFRLLNTTSREQITTTTTTRQSRIGIRTTVVPRVVREVVNDRVVNVGIVPFIRSRTLTFKARGLKPNTKFFPYFDNVAVSANVAPDAGFGQAGGTNFNDALISDGTGKVEGRFTIPNTDTLRFRTGKRVFRITDDRDNSNLATSYADATYNATGVLENVQRTITSVREPVFIRQEVTDSRVIRSFDSRIEESTRRVWQDPLAQSFLIDGQQFPNGIFISKLDLYFFTKDSSIPVFVQIREMDNGLPTQTMLPFGESIVDAANVNVSDDATVATTFEFPSVVYLRPDQEYCFVIMSNSNNYNSFISTVGQRQLNSDRIISEQPYAGSLFKSQNSSTWTPDQTRDIKFTMYKSLFDIEISSEIHLVNNDLESATLGSLPIVTKNGDSRVRILHPNHGMPNGSTVTIKMPDGTDTGTSLNGIAISTLVDSGTLQKNYTISDAQLDSYIIDTTDNADASGRVGPSGITATECYQGDVFYPVVNQMVLSDTSLDWSVKLTNGKTVHSSQVAYNKSATFANINVNENIFVTQPMIIANTTNETANIAGGSAYDKKSIDFKAVMSSTDPHVSPIIDTKRMSVTTIHNRLDQASSVNSNNETFDSGVVTKTGTDLSMATTGIISSSSTDLDVYSVNKYVTVSGFTDSENNFAFSTPARVIAKTATTLQLDVTGTTTEAAGDSVTISQLENYVDDRASIGVSAPSNYIIRRANLENPANSLRVYLTALIPSSANVDVYYRLLRSDTNELFENQVYVPMTLSDGTNTTPAQNADDYRDYEYEADDIGDFVSFAIKIVLRGDNSSEPPIVEDMRAIALAT